MRAAANATRDPKATACPRFAVKAGMLEVERSQRSQSKTEHQRRTDKSVAFVFVVLHLNLDSRPAKRVLLIQLRRAK